MRILILGANGNLGGQLTEVFTDSNEVIPWDKGEIDITDRELMIKKAIDVKPEVIINCAAYNAVDKCENDPEYEIAKKVNIDGPKFLAEACLKVGATLVHYSSDYVFSGRKKKGYSEKDVPIPINRYGKTKFHGEKRIVEISGSGLKWYLIRTSKLFGPKGSNPEAKQSFFDLILDIAKKKTEIEVVNEELSCFTYTRDLARVTRQLIDEHKGYGIYHIVNEGAVTWYQAVQELFKLTGIKVKLIPVSSDKFSRPALRPKYSILLNTKLPKLRDYREALKDYLQLKITN